jgi:clan AA aspartic protease
MASIRGYFDQDYQPRVSITVRGARTAVTLEAVIDTGFDGFLCLPLTIAVELGLELHGTQWVELADGSVKRDLFFSGQAGFAGRPGEQVEISLTDSEDALVGVEFLAECRLEIDFPKGVVRIHQKPRRGGKRPR